MPEHVDVEKSLDLCLPLGMGAGVWAVSVEKTEKAILSQHENTKQNFKYSIAAPCVRKQPHSLGSGDEQLMQRRNSSPSFFLRRIRLLGLLRLLFVLRGKLEKVEQRTLLLN